MIIDVLIKEIFYLLVEDFFVIGGEVMKVAYRAKEVENIFNSVESGVNTVIGPSSNNSLIDALNGLIGTC